MTLIHGSTIDLSGPLTSRRITDEGFLEAPARLSKAGNVQVYLASELGLDVGSGIEPNRRIRVYRPDTEVFAPNALKSADNKTLTLQHPPKGVSVVNWNEVAVGDVRGVTASGDHTAGTVTIKDPDAIKAVMDGTRQMSCGYDFDLDMTAGTSPGGEAHDAVMRNIVINHHAIVDAARGGPGCRIADNQPKETNMALRIIARDGLTVQVEDDKAAIIEKMLSDADKATAAAVTAKDAAVSDKAAADAALKAANEAHTKAAADAAKALADAKALIPTPEELQALVAEHSALVGDAATLAPEFKVEGLAVQAIRAGVVAAVIADDEDLKPFAESILKASGQTDPTKASDATLKSVIAALVPMKAKATTGDDDITRARDRALAGDDNDRTPVRKTATGDRAPKLFGRDAMMHRESVLRGAPIEATK